MSANKYLLILGILGVAAFVCFAEEQPSSSERKDSQALVQGNNRFALELYAKLRVNEGNLFFSPYSISTALAMTYAGAREGTAGQMAKTLRLPTEQNKAIDSDRLAAAFGRLQKGLKGDPEREGYELSVANALWGQRGYEFKDRFLDLVRAGYDGRLSELDFIADTESARKTINDWVEKKTKNKIKELIKPGSLGRDTRLVLTNAIYFKGAWSAPFQEGMTRPAPFSLADGGKIDVPMMNQSDKFKYAETGSFQMLEMPYAGDDLSMVIFLPKEAGGLGDFEKTLNAKSISEWLGKLRRREVIVSVPKFKMTSEFSMASVLKSMGMTDAFTPGAADFSGMNGRKDLFISAVVHKAFVEVNEEGTEAAAATGVTMRITSMPINRPPIFRADHPFLFLIRHNKTGSVLFIGRVANPGT